MKKYLLLLILPFIFLNNVKADECVNLMPQPTSYSTNNFGHTNPYYDNKLLGFSINQNYSNDNRYTIYLKPNTSYTFYFLKNNELYEPIPSDASKFGAPNTYYYVNSDFSHITFNTNISAYVDYDFRTAFTFVKSNPSNNFEGVEFWLVEGSDVCIPSGQDNPDTPDTPDSPDNPTPSDNPINDYYSIYLDKLGLLANTALENKYLLSFVAIILSFIFLEFLFLLLPNKRGHK